MQRPQSRHLWIVFLLVFLVGTIIGVFLQKQDRTEVCSEAFVFAFLLCAYIVAREEHTIFFSVAALCIGVSMGFIYLYTPLLIANASPVLFSVIPVIKKWNLPINKKLFGKNKTWRGLIGGTLVGSFVGLILVPEKGVLWSVQWGALLGFGALLGDLLFSRLKRVNGIKPGDPSVWDRIDYTLVAILLSFFLKPPNNWSYLFTIPLIFVISFVASTVANKVAYYVGWKKVPH